MSLLRKYEVEVTFEMRRSVTVGAETEEDAARLGVESFRDEFADTFEASAPSSSELDVLVLELT